MELNSNLLKTKVKRTSKLQESRKRFSNGMRPCTLYQFLLLFLSFLLWAGPNPTFHFLTFLYLNIIAWRDLIKVISILYWRQKYLGFGIILESHTSQASTLAKSYSNNLCCRYSEPLHYCPSACGRKTWIYQEHKLECRPGNKLLTTFTGIELANDVFWMLGICKSACLNHIGVTNVMMCEEVYFFHTRARLKQDWLFDK